MFDITTFLILALMAGPVTLAQEPEGHAEIQAPELIVGKPEPNVEAPTDNQQASSDASDRTSPTTSRRTRGQPRVSRTRCALVSCGTQCAVKDPPEAPVRLVSVSQPATCSVRQAQR